MTPALPTPWRVVTSQSFRASTIYAADGELVETVYGRTGDLDGALLAERVVTAVNRATELGTHTCEGCGAVIQHDPRCARA